MTMSKRVLVPGAIAIGLLAMAAWIAFGTSASIPAQAAAGPCIPPSLDQVSWWPGDGHAQDIVGSNHGTLIGGSFTPGVVLDAFHFDGLPDQVLVPDSSSLDVVDELTIDAWINPSHVVLGGIVTKFSASSGYGFFVRGDSANQLMWR